jgi:elongation factor P
MLCQVTIWNERVVSIILPPSAEYTVVDDASSGSRQSSSSSRKMMILDTGATVSVPSYVNVNDRIMVSTETAEYISRVDVKKF